jgi:hypothetical protein
VLFGALPNCVARQGRCTAESGATAVRSERRGAGRGPSAHGAGPTQGRRGERRRSVTSAGSSRNTLRRPPSAARYRDLGEERRADDAPDATHGVATPVSRGPAEFVSLILCSSESPVPGRAHLRKRDPQPEPTDDLVGYSLPSGSASRACPWSRRQTWSHWYLRASCCPTRGANQRSSSAAMESTGQVTVATQLSLDGGLARRLDDVQSEGGNRSCTRMMPTAKTARGSRGITMVSARTSHVQYADIGETRYSCHCDPSWTRQGSLAAREVRGGSVLHRGVRGHIVVRL